MKRLDDSTDHLGFCVKCIRVRWLRYLIEPEDEAWRRESIYAPDQGICRQCAREMVDEVIEEAT